MIICFGKSENITTPYAIKILPVINKLESHNKLSLTRIKRILKFDYRIIYRINKTIYDENIKKKRI